MDKVIYTNKMYEDVIRQKPKRILFRSLIVLFFLGVIYGSLLARNADGYLVKISESFLLAKQSETFLSATLSSLISSFVFLLLLFLNGFSAVGQPFSIFILFFKGMGLGITMGHFYINLGFKGVLTSLILLVPAGVISGYAILLATRESIKLSNVFFKITAVKNFALQENAFKGYCRKYLLLVLLSIASAVLSGVSTLLYSKFL